MDNIRELLTQVLEGQNTMLKSQQETSLRLNEMSKSLHGLEQTVVGNEKYGQKGLVKDVEEIKQYIEKDKMRNAKVVGGLAVVGFVWAVVFKYIFG